MKRPSLEDIIMLHIDLFLNLASEKIDCNDLLDWIKGHIS